MSYVAKKELTGLKGGNGILELYVCLLPPSLQWSHNKLFECTVSMNCEITGTKDLVE